MSDDITTAWIAASASLVVSLVSLGTTIWTTLDGKRTQASLERLRSRLDDENDAEKAKRDYEYEARKRLYEELYPLAFQLRETANSTQNRIKNLARAAREGHLAENDDNWMTAADPYYFTSVVRAVIAPAAVYELITRKLTLLDLRLDEDLGRQCKIASAAYQTLRGDFDLIDPARYPAIDFGRGGA